MTAEYKLYHGAVLAELIDNAGAPISVEAVFESGRLLNYMIDATVGFQVKYCTNRLRPWAFTFTQSHIDDLNRLRWLSAAYLVLVCKTDGIVTVSVNEALHLLRTEQEGAQSWLRADRRKREMYKLSGPSGEHPTKIATGVEPILRALRQQGVE